ncbi:MAG: hypothetical protein ACTSQ8_27260 [Candidatus Helarchaeota archaeon]
MAEYGQNILYLRGRIVKIQERMVGEAKDILLVTALLNIPNPRSSYIVEVEAFGKTAERIIAAVPSGKSRIRRQVLPEGEDI